MSQIITQPVLKCKRCGKWLTVTSASTFAPDPEKTQLHIIMKAVLENALCDNCRRAKQYYIDQGRLDDWEAGRP